MMSLALYDGQVGFIGYVLHNGRQASNDFTLIMSFGHYFGGEGRYHAGRALTRIVSPCLRHWEYFSEQQVLTSI